jgi:hypothetical protein
MVEIKFVLHFCGGTVVGAMCGVDKRTWLLQGIADACCSFDEHGIINTPLTVFV